MSELAILRISTPNSTHLSTDTSSNGVTMRHHAGFADGFDHRAQTLPRHLRVERLLDVADVGAVAEILVNEGIDVAELQLDRGMDVVEAHDPREIADDLAGRARACPSDCWQVQERTNFRKSKLT